MKVSCGCSLYLCFLQYRDNPRMCSSSDCSHSSGVVLTYLSLLLMLSHFVLIKFSQLLPKFTQYVVLSSTTVEDESTTKFSLFSGRVITKLIKIMYKTGHYWGVGKGIHSLKYLTLFLFCSTYQNKIPTFPPVITNFGKEENTLHVLLKISWQIQICYDWNECKAIIIEQIFSINPNLFFRTQCGWTVQFILVGNSS